LAPWALLTLNSIITRRRFHQTRPSIVD
jgi:hypothetical protein